MNIVCYGHPSDKIFYDMWVKIQKTSPELGPELYRSLDSFAARLRQPGRKIAFAMLYITDKETVSGLLVVRPLLQDLPVVILLNDQEPEILQFCHQLRPRIIMYTDWKLKEICSVLERCIGKYGKREEAWTIDAKSPGSKEDHELKIKERLSNG
jgi:hypothetical protein